MQIAPDVRRRHGPGGLFVRGKAGWWAALAVAAVLAVGGGTAAAEDGDQYGPLVAAARAGVEEGRVVKGKMLGFNIHRGAFTELPSEGAVLVGFDCGVGDFGDIETVYALRPVYQTANGEAYYEDHGLFTDRREGRNGVVRSPVRRTVRVRARPGYAVGGMTLRTGLNINGLSVRFMRIAGKELDPSRAYNSEWVGDRTGGGEATISGNGSPVVGVYGTQDKTHVSSLGLLFLPRPAPPPEPLPREAKPPEQAEAPAPAAPEPPPAEAKPAAADKPAPAAKPDDDDDDEPAEASGGMNWLPVVVFGGVTLPVLVICLVCFGHKSSGHEESPRRVAPPRPRPTPAAPPTAPTSPATAPADATAFQARPGLDLAPRPTPAAAAVAIAAGTPRGQAEKAEAIPYAQLKGEDIPVARLARDVRFAPGEQPAYVTGRVRTRDGQNMIYRVYLFAEEMLVLYAGPEKVKRPPVYYHSFHGGLLGGLLVGLTLGISNWLARKQAQDRLRRLDRAGVDELVKLAETERNSCRAGREDLVCARIDPPSLWEHGFNADSPGQLYFRHRTRGEYTLEFLTAVDMQAAMQALPGALGDRLAVNAVWDESRHRFVRKP